MSLTRRIFASSAQLTLANALARALGIVSLPLLTRWLAPAAYGQATLASTLMSLVSVLGLMGMDMSYARGFLSRTPPNGVPVETFCWRFAWLAASAAGMVAAGVWSLHAYRDASALPSLAALVFVGAAGSLLLAMAQTRSRLHNRHARLATAVALGGILAAATSLCLAWRAMPDERALMMGYVAAYLIPLVVMGMPGLAKLRVPSGLTAEERKAVFLVGLPGVVTAPMYWILSSADRWFLQASVDSAAVGIYSVACTFGQLGMMVNSALLAIWLPEATRLHESVDREESDKALGILVVRLVAVLMLVWMGVGVLGGDVLRLLSDGRFHVGASVVPWIASGVFFYGCYHLANTGLFLGRRLKLSAAVWILVGAASSVANGLLIPRFGMMAAAYVQCGTFALLASIVLAVSQKQHPIRLPGIRLLVALALAVSALVLGARLPAIEDWHSLAYKIFLLCATSALVIHVLVPEAAARGKQVLGGLGRAMKRAGAK